VGSAGHIEHSGASGAWNSDALFYKLEWDWYGFHKKRVRTCDTKLIFLHPVGSVDHVVHSDVPGAQNINGLFFMFRWDGAVSIKSVVGHIAPNFYFCIRRDLWVT
jgi:hypothetical protein